MENIIEVKDLKAGYGRSMVFENIGFSVKKGDYVGLAGPNGAGKTTLVKAMLGLVPGEGGTIKFFGKEIDNNFDEWNKIGYLPQSFSTINPLFPATVREAVATGLLAGKKFPRRMSPADDIAVDKALRSLGIYEIGEDLVSDISGGQKQRVFLARALAGSPEILILDEPSTALDPVIRDDFFRKIKELNNEEGMTVIMITHDIGFIGQYANKLLYLDKKILFYGSFGDFCISPDMNKQFGEFSQHLICHQHE